MFSILKLEKLNALKMSMIILEMEQFFERKN